MATAQNEDDSRLDRQWDLLEAYYRQGRPVVARLLGTSDGKMRFDVNGVQGYVERFVHGVTLARPIKEGTTQEEAPEEMLAALKEAARRSMKDLTGEERLLRIVELDRESKHLVLSQKLSEQAGSFDDFEVGGVYTGLVAAINTASIRVYLRGVMGGLFAKQQLPNQEGVFDLSSVLHLGQEVRVRVKQKQGKMLWFMLESLSSEM